MFDRIVSFLTVYCFFSRSVVLLKVTGLCILDRLRFWIRSEVQYAWSCIYMHLRFIYVSSPITWGWRLFNANSWKICWRCCHSTWHEWPLQNHHLRSKKDQNTGRPRRRPQCPNKQPISRLKGSPEVTWLSWASQDQALRLDFQHLLLSQRQLQVQLQLQFAMQRVCSLIFGVQIRVNNNVKQTSLANH